MRAEATAPSGAGGRANDTRVAVIGAGVAGCAAAYTLQKLGHGVVVLEAAPTVGGRTTTVHHDGFAIDAGAVYLLSIYDRTTALLDQLGVDGERLTWSPPAGLWDGTRVHRVRYDMLPSFLALPLLSWRAKLRLARKGLALMLGPAPAAYDTDSLAAFDFGETMEAWSRRELGDEVHEYLVRPWIEPAFGVGCERLAAPFLRAVLKRAHQARFAIPATGMGAICERLTVGLDVRTDVRVDRLENGGGEIRLHAGTDALAVDAAVVATDGPAAGELLRGAVSGEASAALAGAPYSTMIHAAVAYNRDPWPDAPVDMVLPVGPGEHPVVGIILHGRKSPNAVPPGAQLVDVYFNDRFSLAATDADARMGAVAAIDEMLGPAPSPSFIDLFRFERALALAPPGHYADMQRLRRSLPPRIQLAGDYLAHLGVETAVLTGQQAAEAIHLTLGSSAAATDSTRITRIGRAWSAPVSADTLI